MDRNGKLLMNITAKIKLFYPGIRSDQTPTVVCVQRFLTVTHGSNWNLVNQVRIKGRILIILRLTSICTGERYGMRVMKMCIRYALTHSRNKA